jgi:hypothetical protein
MAHVKNAELAEELRRTVAADNPDREKLDDVVRRVVQAAREPGDAYAFGRACGSASDKLGNPFDQVNDRYRHFAWRSGAKEGARTEACGSHQRAS